ncbi:IS66 family insertion sequence element accessory protein TnpB [Fluviispira multicolorata]|uniref:IS66 family insertion sequence element accessory protein TnpB n=2 Tax=Fluviispira multicolorata TaxID=2654512 RepID=A0A833JB15_9BACT|nr:IS66 family insertion sequence element accessory protein TnpB [Fluviispira multicolorata]
MVISFYKGTAMKSYREFTSIYLCVKPVDFRKGIYGLVNLIQYEMNDEPFSGMLFLFTNKNRRNIRAVYWDKTGFAIWTKALEKEKFPWPKKNPANKVTLDQDQFYWILSGINPWKLNPHQELNYSIIT